jgi:hypothetical protein
MVISDVVKCKKKIMNKLIEIPDVFLLINNKCISKPSEMMFENIFPYFKVSDARKTVNNYICFDYNSRISSKNSSFKDITINIGVICHKDDIKTPWGSRHDVLAGVIIDSLIWEDILGFNLELISDIENILQNDYHTRTLQFKNLAINSINNGVHSGVY